eukprot:TRINITY_DN24847_c0_g1_i1.p1 TRINITY_DN24847_c0_g1~~TRINITY_DN24847_c0_g1_i1.p1  ORF type:complete len:288 (-),score=78.18 TRINITY_DN24847_c0_g1_i1:10-873(-)
MCIRDRADRVRIVNVTSTSIAVALPTIASGEQYIELAHKMRGCVTFVHSSNTKVDANGLREGMRGFAIGYWLRPESLSASRGCMDGGDELEILIENGPRKREGVRVYIGDYECHVTAVAPEGNRILCVTPRVSLMAADKAHDIVLVVNSNRKKGPLKFNVGRYYFSSKSNCTFSSVRIESVNTTTANQGDIVRLSGAFGVNMTSEIMVYIGEMDMIPCNVTAASAATIDFTWPMLPNNSDTTIRVYKKGLGWIRFRDHTQAHVLCVCLLYTSPSPRDGLLSRMPSSA